MSVSTLSASAPVSKTAHARRIVVARVVGFCFGVRRAVDLTLKARRESTDKITTAGPVVHNPVVTERLRESGVGAAASIRRRG